MPSPRRLEKLNRTLLKEISTIIMTEVKDPRMLSMVSVLSATLSKDMNYLKVEISIYGEDMDNNRKTFNALKNSAGYISSIASKNLRMRSAPAITFILTSGIEDSVNMYYKIKELSDDNESDETED